MHDSMRCAACGCAFDKDPRYESSLFGSWRALLCLTCHKTEKQIIDEEGTNDIPELLGTYELSQ